MSAGAWHHYLDGNDGNTLRQSRDSLLTSHSCPDSGKYFSVNNNCGWAVHLSDVLILTDCSLLTDIKTEDIYRWRT